MVPAEAARLLAPIPRCACCAPQPFGKEGSLANKFVAHAAAFRPRLIALIVPPNVRIPPGYAIVYENSKLCGDGEPRDGCCRGGVSLHCAASSGWQAVGCWYCWAGVCPPRSSKLATRLAAITVAPTHALHSPTHAHFACHPNMVHAAAAAEEFYVPGSTHRSWNKVWPVLRIMQRQEVSAHHFPSCSCLPCCCLLLSFCGLVRLSFEQPAAARVVAGRPRIDPPVH
jgi:hypothetical protein